MWAGRAYEDGISFNRRYLMKDGSVQMNPSQMNPNIVRPAGPIDPEVAVLYFEAPDSRPLATLVNFALHTTTWGGPDFSSDYPGILAGLLADVKGGGMQTVFMQGCSGNINQVDVRTQERQSGPGAAARTATILAADVLKAWREMQPVDAPLLRVRSRYVDLAVPEYSAEQVRKAHEVLARLSHF